MDVFVCARAEYPACFQYRISPAGFPRDDTRLPLPPSQSSHGVFVRTSGHFLDSLSIQTIGTSIDGWCLH